MTSRTPPTRPSAPRPAGARCRRRVRALAAGPFLTLLSLALGLATAAVALRAIDDLAAARGASAVRPTPAGPPRTRSSTGPWSAPIRAWPRVTVAAGGAPLTVYIAGSETQAEAARSALAEGDALGVRFGRPLARAEVVVVTTADEERQLRQELIPVDAGRDDAGFPWFIVIDLRDD